MFRDRVFNISFLISSGWHLFCILVFVLVITPKGFTLNKFPETSFLGPILETGTFQPGYNTGPVYMVTPYREDFAYSGVSSAASYDYFEKRAISDENLEKSQFLEPAFEKQVPSADLLQDDKN